MLLRRTALAVAASLALLGLTAPPSHAVPTLTLVASLDPAYPQQVPAASGSTTPIRFTVTSSEASEVTASASGPGLETDAAHSLGTVSGAKGFAIAVRGLAPGFHTLTVTVTADGAAPATVDVPLLWTSGTPLSPGTGDLAGRAYGWNGVTTYGGVATRGADLLVFLEGGLVYRGLPPKGRPTCTAVGLVPGGRCLGYAYSPTTGLVQVGTEIIGRLAGAVLYTSGFAAADVPNGELYASYLDSTPLTFSTGRTRLHGTWSYASTDRPRGVVAERVSFRRGGRYKLSFTEDGAKRTLAGTYALDRHGRVAFRSKGKVRQVGTLLLGGSKVGTGKPKKFGLWLVLGGKRGTSGDGNLLTRGR